MPGVEKQAEDRVVHLVEQPFDLRPNVDESGGVQDLVQRSRSWKG